MNALRPAAKAAFDHCHKLEALRKRKNPRTAAILAVVGGPIGLAFYTGSIVDFLVPMLIIIIGSVGTAGLFAPIGWLITALWGFKRVTESNKRLDTEAATGSRCIPLQNRAELGHLRRGVAVIDN